MPLNIRVALWLTHLLCPRIGTGAPSHRPPKKPMPSSAQSSQAPDFIPDRDLAAADRAFRRYNDEDYETVANWAAYCARQKSTYHHLERCLDQSK
jgi:hypothetical protein